MNCAEARRALSDGIGDVDPAVEEHLETCEDCALAALDAMGASLRGAPAEPDAGHVEELLGQVKRRLGEERGLAAWLRSLPTAVRLGIGAIAAAGLPLAYALAEPRVDLAGYPKARLLLVAIGLLGLVALSLRVKLRPLFRPPLSFPVARLLVVLSLALVALDAGLPAAHSRDPAFLAGTGPDFLPAAMKCLLAGLAIGLPALLLTAMLDRSNDGWRDASVLGAVLAGLAGYLALHLHCPIVAPAHLMAGHVTVLVVFLAAYAVLRGPGTKGAT